MKMPARASITVPNEQGERHLPLGSGHAARPVAWPQTLRSAGGMSCVLRPCLGPPQPAETTMWLPPVTWILVVPSARRPGPGAPRAP